MALNIFGSNEKATALENDIKQKISQLPLLHDILEQLLCEDYEDWMDKGQGYNDNLIRTVTIRHDYFDITWEKPITHRTYVGKHDVNNVPKMKVERETETDGVSYCFTEWGYKPIANHYNEKGTVDFSYAQVCRLLAELIKERLSSKIHDCEFGNVQFFSSTNPDDSGASFTYKVPAHTYKSWF